MTKLGFGFARGVSGLALAAASFGMAPLAYAQDEGAAEAPSGDRELIIVTGSRLARDSFNAPTPVQAVSSERMEDLAIADVGDALIQLPSFRPITGPNTNSFRPGSNISARSLDLRGLGTARTLTLVDGRRVVPNGEDGRVDLNTLPSIMVARSDVVTGGASAQYGADAVAGVVNLILDTNYEGIKAEGSYGISEYGDGEQVRLAAKLGSAFAGGRGHIVFGAEYVDEDEVGDFNARPWAARWRNFPGNPFWSAAGGNDLPQTVSIDNVLFAGTPGGAIINVSPLQGLQFNEQGNLVPFDFGDPRFFNPASPGIFLVDPDPAVDDLYGFNRSALITPSTHKAALLNIDYDVSDTVRISTGASYGHTEGVARGAYAHNLGGGAIRLQIDNAFLNDTTRQMMLDAGVTNIPLSRANRELSGTDYFSYNEVWRAHFGAEGEFANGWGWDFYYQWGQNKSRMEGENIQLTPYWNAAVDAVFAPAGNILGVPEGTIVCRRALTEAAYANCIPTSVIGANAINPGTIEYSMSQPGDIWQTRRFEQHVFSANVQGTPIQLWAGDVDLAGGFEYRIDKAEGDADTFSAIGFTRFNSTSILPSITQKVLEAYVEAGVPLMADSAVGDLRFEGAVRFSDYNLQGSAWTWKGGLIWDVNDALMFRVTRSRDVRQPNAGELNPNQTSGNLPLPDPGLNLTYDIPTFTGGNPNLQLEKADTWTIGGVLQPGFLPDFRLSLDFYDINVKGGIDTLSAILAVQLCREGNTAVCTIGGGNIHPSNQILEIFSTFQNVSTLKAQGFEMVMNYSYDLGSAGSLNFTLNGAYQTELESVLASGDVLEFVNFTGNSGSVTSTIGVPRWRTSGVLTWDMEDFSVTAHGRYIPPGLLNTRWIGPHQSGYSPDTPGSVSDNRISGRFYLDMSGAVTLLENAGRKVELFGSVANVFDRDPPKNLRLFGNGLYFDSFGRYYRGGLRIEM